MMRQVGSGPYGAASESVHALMTACAVFFACARCPIFAAPNQSHSVELVDAPLQVLTLVLVASPNRFASGLIMQKVSSASMHANDEASWLRALRRGK